jgi:hypothetical protein
MHSPLRKASLHGQDRTVQRRRIAAHAEYGNFKEKLRDVGAQGGYVFREDRGG